MKKRLLGALILLSASALSAHAAPVAINDLTASSASQVRLIWTSPDNGEGGASTSYMVKYSSGGDITNDTEFNQASTYVQSWTPQGPGNTENVLLTGFMPDTTYWFSIKSSFSSQWSDISAIGTNYAVATAFYRMWSPGEVDSTYSIAWGDCDNDGDLDQLVGNNSSYNRVYRNNGNRTFTLVWSSVETDATYSIAWGDCDNDGDLDQLVGNYGAYNQVYRKNSTNTYTLIWSSEEADTTYSIAWGDYDNDGDLDQLVGNYGSNNRVYRNNGNSTFTLVWSSEETEYAYSIAWGDYDNDGDLDQLVGNNGSYNRVYRNNGYNTFTPVWNSEESDSTYSIAWGDYDNDGDLDQLVGNNGSYNRVYRNNGDSVFMLVWSCEEANSTCSVAWGDYDNDGDLDQLVGNTGNYNRVYRNNGDNTFTPVWSSEEMDATYSVAWGDCDNDGDLDQLVGNSGEQNRIYISNYSSKQVNTAPSAPSGSSSSIGPGYVMLKWSPGNYDTGNSSHSLYYNIAVATAEMTLSGDGLRLTSPTKFTLPWTNGSPLLGNYVRPAVKVWPGDGADKHGFKLASVKLTAGATYYWRVQTIDAGFAKSQWSGASSMTVVVPPLMVTDLTASTSYQILLSWTAPDNSFGGACAGYLLKCSTAGDITNETEFNQASTYVQSWTPLAPGNIENKLLTGLMPETTYWFSIKSKNNLIQWSDISSTGAVANYAVAASFYPVWSPVEAEGTYSLAWGDFDNDGDLDQLVGNISQANRVYRNNGNRTFTLVWSSVETDPTCSISWGDYDNDGDLDQLVGNNGAYNHVYRKNSTNTYTLIWSSEETDPTYSIAWGDYDNDGDLDQLVGNYGSNNRVYRNNGNSTFTLAWSSEEVEYAYSIAWGDYDNDGDLDQLVGNTGNYNRVYRNNGYNTFTPVWNSEEADPTYSVAWGDYDNDGDLDQLVGNNGSYNRVYRNNGDSVFMLVWSCEEANSTCSVAWGDYDNDGDLDQLIGNNGSPNRVYCNNGDSTFMLAWSSDEAETTTSVAWGDCDNDGDLDQLVGNNGELVRIYVSGYSSKKMNTAPSTPSGFSSSCEPGYIMLKWSPGNYDTGNSSHSLYYNIAVATAEMTLSGDGLRLTSPTKFTLPWTNGSPLFGNYVRPAVKVWPGESTEKHGYKLATALLAVGTTYYWRVQTIDAGFAKSQWSSASTATIVVPPLNVTDLTAYTSYQILLSWTAPDDSFGQACTEYLVKYSTAGDITSDAEFNAAQSYPQGWSPLGPGNLEMRLLTGLIPETTYWFAIKSKSSMGWSAISSTGTGTNFAVSVIFYINWSAEELDSALCAAWGDYDNDGDLDQLVGNAGQANRVYRNNGNNQFTLTWSSEEADVTYSITWGDYDNDGDLDQLVGNNSGENRVYRNDGVDTFILVWSSEETDATYGVAWGDCDNDGDLDQFVGSYNQQSRVYRNNGGNTFSLIWSSEDGSDTTSCLACGDYDNDGDLDLLTGTGYGVPNRVYRNNSDNTFTPVWSSGEVDTTYSVAWGDYDNDGDLDQLIGNSGSNRLYRNDGSDTFTVAWISEDVDTTYSVAWGDFDNDGDLDQLVGNTGNNRIYRNDGNDTFILAWSSEESDDTHSIAWGDYDNDGDLDQLAASYGLGNRVYVSEYRNKTANAAPDAPAEFSSSFSSAAITLRWEGAAFDVETSSCGLYYAVRVGTGPGGTNISSSVVSGCYGSPMLGSYIRPKLSDNELGLKLNKHISNGTTVYWSVRTIDTGLRAGAWSEEQSTLLQGAPYPVHDLTAVTSSQVLLSWTPPYGDATSYELRYATNPITSEAEWLSAEEYHQDWIPVSWGQSEVRLLTGLIPEATNWFAIRAVNSYGASELDTTNPEPFTYVDKGFKQAWSSEEMDATYSIAWGDYDNDGDLDQLVGNTNYEPNHIYRNNGNGTFALVWSSLETDNTLSIAFGDYDNDGDLDQLVGNSGAQNRIYRNDGSDAFTPVWSSDESDDTRSVAWGDYDNDGDLDQLIGNYAYYMRVYRNNGGDTFTLTWSSEATDITYSVAWGDYDNDGDLDQLAGNYGAQNKLYRNDGNDTFMLAWSASSGENTYSIAWGDYDNDGDLDQLVGNIGNNRVYRNDGSDTFTLAWSSEEADSTCSIAWGDYDNDGDLDQLVGNINAEPNRIYRNDGSDMFTLVWSSEETDMTYSIAWGDYDNDGDLDQLVGNYGEQNRVYVSWYSKKKTNIAPDAPAGFSTFFGAGFVRLEWSADNYDTGNSSHSLYYNVVLATQPIGVSADGLRIESPSKLLVSWQSGSPLMGNYVRPAVNVWPGGSAAKHGFKLSSALFVPGAEHYWRVQAIDAGFARSLWSGASTTTVVVPPLNITDLTAYTSYQILLSWTAPDNGFGQACTEYLVKYSTAGDITSDAGFNAAQSYPQAWAPLGPGNLEMRLLTGFMPDTTYWFSIKSKNSLMEWSGISSTGAVVNYAVAALFYPAWSPEEVDATYSVAWGDYDNDGDLDQLVGNNGYPNRVYRNNGNSTFTLIWTSEETEYALGVSWGDYDNDGDLDQLVGNYNNYNRIYRNNGNNTFTPVWNSEEMDPTCSIVWGDCDNDGDLDQLVGNYSSNNRVYRNNGDSTFTLIWNSEEVEYAYSAVWGDYDNDGDLDQLVGNYSSYNRVYRNNGDNTFTPVWNSEEADTTYSTAWGDCDNDGDLDQLVGNSGNNRVYRNNGDSTFTLAWSSDETDNTYSIAWGDYDNDGYLDQLAGNYGSCNRMYRNNGDNTFTVVWNSDDTDATQSVALGDCDNDGDLDQLIGNNGEPIRIYFSGYSSIKMNAAPSSPSGLTTVSFGTAVEFRWSGGSYDVETSSCGLYYAVRIGTGTAGTKTSSSTVSGCYGSPLLGMYVRPKLSYEQYGLRVNLTRGTTYHWSVKTIDSGMRASAWSVEQSTYIPRLPPIPVTDLVAVTDNQIKLAWTSPEIDASYELRYSTDAAITNATEWNNATAYPQSWTALSAGTTEEKVLTGLMPGTTIWFAIRATNDIGTSGLDTSDPEPCAVAPGFALIWSSQEADYSYGVALGDYDNDGDLDQLVGNSNNEPNRVYRNNGDNTFTPVWSSEETDTTISVAWGDYDNDGDLDQLVGNQNQNNRVYRNDGGSVFALVWSSDETDTTMSVAWGDYDNDGDLDQLVGNQNQNNRIYSNGGGNVFAITWNSDETDTTMSVAWGDYDNDGDLDQLIGDYGQSNHVYRNDGGGVFTAVWSSPEIEASMSVAWGDYDNDGDLDQLVANDEASSRIYRNDGNNEFTSAESVEYNETYSIAWGDIDNDGDLDFLCSGFALANRVYLSEYNRLRQNVRPAAPAGLTYTVTPSSVTLQWAPSQYDAGNSSNSLCYNIAIATEPMTLSGDGLRIESPSTFVVSWTNSSPLFGNYVRPSVNVWPGASTARYGMVYSTSAIDPGTAYYWRVQAIDAGLMRSVWSAEAHTTVLRVEIDIDTFGFGNLEVGSSSICVTCAVMTNTGNSSATFEVAATTNTPGTPWAISTSSGVDRFILWGVFSDERPDDADFGDEDKLSQIYKASTDSSFAVNSGYTGKSVPPGQSRKFWWKIQMPTVSNTGVQQEIKLNTAGIEE